MAKGHSSDECGRSMSGKHDDQVESRLRDANKKKIRNVLLQRNNVKIKDPG